MMENVHKIKIKLENIWFDLIRGIYAPYNKCVEKEVSGTSRDQPLVRRPVADSSYKK